MKSKREFAVILRKAGHSYTEIARRTGYSKSTLSYHLSKIPYTPNKETISRVGMARIKAYQTKNAQKLQTYKEARLVAMQEVGALTARDVLMVGIGLYAGEGSKTNDMVRLVNNDPRILRFFIAWLEQLGVQKNHVMLRVHAYPEMDCTAAERFWLSQLGLSTNNLQRTLIDSRKGKSVKKRGMHKYGTAHLTVRSFGEKPFGVLLARKIRAFMEIVLQ